MSAPPLLRPPGSGSRNPKSPRLKLPSLAVNSAPVLPSLQSHPYAVDLSNASKSPLTPSLLANKLGNLDISSPVTHTSTPSTAASDGLSMFSAEIIAEMDSNHSSSTQIKTPPIIIDNADSRTAESTLKCATHYITADSTITTTNTTLRSATNDNDDNDNDVHTLILPHTRIRDVDSLDLDEWKNMSRNGEIVELGVLGEGAGGSVSRCKLKHGKTVFALKQIISDTSAAETQKQILRELQFNKSCKSPFIVKYYGMFLNEVNASICITMEYMDGRSLDSIYKKVKVRGGIIGEKVLGKVAESVLKGLSYLHEHKIIHRDIKPQNILLNTFGEVKLCDFGVSGEVVNSLATTFTGTSYYMAPERIQGHPYSVTSDVWSLGLTLLEVAKGKFPLDIDVDGTSPIEVLILIMGFTPELDEREEIQWSSAFRSFLDYCLKKNPSERASPRQMLSHPWIVGQSKKKVNMAKFVQQCWENELE